MRRGIGSLRDIIPNTENLEDMKMEKLEWLWPQRIPLGKITLLVGDSGVGKSFCSLDIAAHVSTGRPWPDDVNVPCRKGSVLLISAEDDINDTILPRLNAAKADLSKFSRLQDITIQCDGRPDKLEFFDLKKGILALEHLKEKFPDLVLLVIDPITSYMGDINSHDNAEVRSVLDKVADWAARNKVAVLAISHLNKNTKVGANYRIMGSIAFTAVSRMIWHVVADQNDRERRLLLPGISNVAPNILGLAFRLQSVKVGEKLIDSAVCQWEDESVDETADEMLQTVVAGLASTSRNCGQWMKDFLKDGPVLATDCWAASDAAGFSPATVNRIKKKLGVTSVRSKAFDDQWVWKL